VVAATEADDTLFQTPEGAGGDFASYQRFLKHYNEFAAAYAAVQRLRKDLPLFLETDGFLNYLFHEAPGTNKGRQSAIDGRTTRHAGYAISQQKRKRVEEIFGWMKTVGGMRKLRHRGIQLVGWMFTFAAAAYNLVRIRNLVTANAGGKA